MSQRGALVCVGSGDREAAPRPSAAPRWRRRPRAAHTGTAPLRVTAPAAATPPPVVITTTARVASPRSRPGWARLLLGVTLAGGLALVGALARAHVGDAAFSQRIAQGCEELAPCRALEAEAALRVEACTLFCGRAAAEHRSARLLRYRAEERQAVLDHYRERERSERLERERERARQVDEWQRREAARAAQAERDQRERLELERVRQVHIDRRLAEQRQRRAAYYGALGPEGRAKRLKGCLATTTSCDGLVLDLLDAARDDAERRTLAQLNVGIAPPEEKRREGQGAARAATHARTAEPAPSPEPVAAESVPATPPSAASDGHPSS